MLVHSVEVSYILCLFNGISQTKEGILPVATLNVTHLTVWRQRCTFSEAYIAVYKGDDNFVTSGATLLPDLDLQKNIEQWIVSLLVEYLLYSVGTFKLSECKFCGQSATYIQNRVVYQDYK